MAGREASPAQRYDLQQAARWLEQALPFALLLLMVFIWENAQGLLIVGLLTVVLVKLDGTIRRQAAFKNEMRCFILIMVSIGLVLQVVFMYWWFASEKSLTLWRPLLLLPVRHIPSFWQALFIIVVNDTEVRFVSMALKCLLLISSRRKRGKALRRQAQWLSLVEYAALLYRALLPAPVWYRFFLNEANGHLFSSLTTGLYLTFKLTATFERVLAFVSSLQAVSCRETQYGSYASTEEVISQLAHLEKLAGASLQGAKAAGASLRLLLSQGSKRITVHLEMQVSAAGDMCTICQEKMHSPISLGCHHVFCEDCVLEWFERERTCPLCRAVVRTAGLRSFGDGSTSLLAQIF
eukprot:SM000324S12596  [mRNA]  locus=s324:72417:74747:- [translate_table: standard]